MSTHSIQASRAAAEHALATSASLQPTQFGPSSTQLTSSSLSTLTTPTQTPLLLSDVVRVPAPTPFSLIGVQLVDTIPHVIKFNLIVNIAGELTGVFLRFRRIGDSDRPEYHLHASNLGKGRCRCGDGGPRSRRCYDVGELGFRKPQDDSLGKPEEGVQTPVSAWLSAGLPDGDVTMQDVSGTVHEGEDVNEEEEEEDISEEAAVGKLSSMSLMAAVTASGVLKEETKLTFAAFAVGVLAKVVPDGLVISSLLPLFETMYQDPTWHVQHCVLFAPSDYPLEAPIK
ncbi:uncharacterized protein LAESUDRAFT_764878 [Laetiporus sulphureus 93-53]|uniref:Uncharacterized protein n=1 Tax=Laetiporus sulphureus 93-53 TaxID=1314785 RepID=A0A165B3D4_9APHY|nr:uncharacterized protein LAESUDRAFT_764878 [Laetiporus sulphureus 93-53]KZT00145.1 hypothetical protein LAESUDRAFT_764878 [Laetiporus sulphureus 93-53]